ncbi:MULTISPECIES: stage II sporulation protein P [Thermoanaerobacterium]|uniref:Stage II sporulation protein P n=2 Tax=Thermoanaerobacterium TaxID=28895 RepID=W9EAD2_9THEO|nr:MULTISPECIES: stage II sporulation protein P [Thermoanaerobacterium]AFK87071.1 stage II sporulation protein P [Thermoanaerobacterium saccharolyticum JW/SL-YS485]ETO38937.1 stage II sporulation protein P [Thermoanaerobacterium aotearoense SCUT27]
MYRSSLRYYRLKKVSFVILLLFNILFYRWLMTNDIEAANINFETETFAEEYNSINGMFITALNYTMPTVDVGYKSEGFYDRDLTIASMFNLNQRDPLKILKYQIPIIAQIDKGEKNNTSNTQVADNHSANQSENGQAANETPKESETTATATNASSVDTGKPLILLYHTHTMESYVATLKNKYVAAYGYDRTNNLNYNMVRVGDSLTEYLTKDYGISVLHDRTIHDYNYDQSYYNSSLSVKKYLEEYPSIKVTIDLHRDGYGSVMQPGVDTIPVLSSLPNQDYRKKYTMEINGQTVAKIMFIIGSRRTADMNEDWKKNYEFAKQISDKLNELYPGISLGIEIHQYAEYNQHFSEKGILIELGSNYNTLEEALNSTPYLAKAIYLVLKDDGLAK